jgi:NTE family protein
VARSASISRSRGAGPHGAFTWGVLDQLLADERFIIDGISGTSAGAVNAVMVADGLARGGPEEARTRLAAFWRAASTGGNLPELQRHVVERLFPFIPRDGAEAWVDALTRFWSPRELNPLNINPLKDLIERFVDFKALRDSQRVLFLAATNVATGNLRVFTGEEITTEAVMASACLPLVFRAVEIDGEAYWDGGYTGNPAILPFLHATTTEDVLLVQINPLQRRTVPESTPEIMNRVSEISFNSALMAELRAIAFVDKLIDEGKLPHGFGQDEYRRIRMHRIALEDPSERLGFRTKVSTDFELFTMLRDLGAQATKRFLDAHADDIGTRATIDLEPRAVAA